MNTATVLAERTVVTGPFSSLRFAAVADDAGRIAVVVHSLSGIRREYLFRVRPNRLRSVARALTALAAELGERP